MYKLWLTYSYLFPRFALDLSWISNSLNQLKSKLISSENILFSCSLHRNNTYFLVSLRRHEAGEYERASMSHNVDFTLTCACGCKVFCISTIAFYAKRMCPERLPEEHETNVPFVRRRHLWRVGPSTRPNAVVAAQRVKFVLCRCRQAVA